MSALTLSAILNKVTSTVDGGWRITFDVPQSDVAKVMSLSALRELSLVLAIVPEEMSSDPLSVLDKVEF